MTLQDNVPPTIVFPGNGPPDPAPPAGMSFEQDDDATTVIDSPEPTSTWRPPRAVVKTTVKLVFTEKGMLPAATVKTRTMEIIRSISSTFHAAVTFYNNKNQRYSPLQNLSTAGFLTHFAISSSPVKNRSNRRPASWLIFSIETDIPISQIRSEISPLLRNHNARLFHYPWPETVKEVASLGFFVGPSPRYIRSTQFQRDIRTLISKNASVTENRIPDFRCSMTTIASSTEQGSSKCQAFDIQVEPKNAKSMLNLLEKAFSVHNTSLGEVDFMPYRCRHVSYRAFGGAITLQRELEDSYRVVAIAGIHPDHFFDFEVRLRQTFPEVIQVLETTSTSLANEAMQPYGKYNLLCSKAAFPTLVTKVEDNLASLYAEYLQSRDLEPVDGAQPVEMISRIRPDGFAVDESSAAGRSRASQMSTLTTRYAEYYEEPEVKDPPNPPPRQAAATATATYNPFAPSYASVATAAPPTPFSRLYASVATAGVSPGDQEAFPPPTHAPGTDGYGRQSNTDRQIDKMIEMMQAMQAMNQTMNQTMNQRMTQMETAVHQLVSNSPPPTPPTADTALESRMEARFTQLAEEIRQLIASKNTHTHLQQHLPSTQDIGIPESFTSPPRKRSHRNPLTPSTRQDGAFIGNDEGSHDEAMTNVSS